MTLRLFRRSNKAIIDALYGAIVAQARLPIFYAGFGVPDTVDGRFDMVVLHLVLVLRRLRQEAQGALVQGLFDAFCRDMDHNLREMGVGDLSVPKQMQRLAQAFYGRQRAYEDALLAGDPTVLAAALGRNILSSRENQSCAALLAGYVRSAARELEAAGAGELAGGRLAFSDPNSILAGAEPL